MAGCCKGVVELVTRKLPQKLEPSFQNNAHIFPGLREVGGIKAIIMWVWVYDVSFYIFLPHEGRKGINEKGEGRRD